MEMNVEKVINDLLEQNAKLRLETAILRAAIQDQSYDLDSDIEEQMKRSQSLDELPPDAIEVLSKFDFR